MRRPPLTGQQASVERDIVGGTGGESVAGVQAFGACAHAPWLDVARHEHVASAGSAQVEGEPTKDTSVAVVVMDLIGEPVLTYPSRRHEQPLVIRSSRSERSRSQREAASST